MVGDQTESEFGTIRVARRHASTPLRFLAYVVVVDDRPVAKVRDGAEVEIDVSSGEHRVRVKRGKQSSEELQVLVRTGTMRRVECGVDRAAQFVALERGMDAGPWGLRDTSTPTSSWGGRLSFIEAHLVE